MLVGGVQRGLCGRPCVCRGCTCVSGSAGETFAGILALTNWEMMLVSTCRQVALVQSYGAFTYALVCSIMAANIIANVSPGGAPPTLRCLHDTLSYVSWQLIIFQMCRQVARVQPYGAFVDIEGYKQDGTPQPPSFFPPSFLPLTTHLYHARARSQEFAAKRICAFTAILSPPSLGSEREYSCMCVFVYACVCVCVCVFVGTWVCVYVCCVCVCVC